MSRHPIKTFLMEQIPQDPSGVVQAAALQFGVSQQAVQKHLQRLIVEGHVLKKGRTRDVRYLLAQSERAATGSALVSHAQPFPSSWEIGVKEGVEEHSVWKQTLAPKLKELPENVRYIAEYAFTELFNNVIDHSMGKHAIVRLSLEPRLVFQIQDDGEGIFNHIVAHTQATTPREAVLHLSKGKLTTDPTRHSGEGIFFSSRLADMFRLESGGLAYLRLNEDDWLLADSSFERGTLVTFQIGLASKKSREALFRRYTDEEDYVFDRTEIAVELAKFPGETYVSRSQAKRILVGLEKFRRVVLDFKNIESVGQGFVDEIYRVFAKAHPEIEITYRNANPNVEFMILRT